MGRFRDEKGKENSDLGRHLGASKHRQKRERERERERETRERTMSDAMADVNPSSEWKLKPHPVLPSGKPCVVCILDGFGENKYKDKYNAVHSARTPNVDKLRANAERCRFVQAHGTWVGLPSNDDMGNSEVGHNAIGKLARSQHPMILFSSQLVSFCLIKCCSI